MASKLYGVNATIIIFVFVLYCIVYNAMGGKTHLSVLVSFVDEVGVVAVVGEGAAHDRVEAVCVTQHLQNARYLAGMEVMHA